ncbi:UDP-3-O-acylglucosamine N-acyltransferase [Striga asiatica]|uniref:UDP-3-O-acylglucosamine N-acyltransferase n=1 Tax=Striga asiatica TaxID=4170 RepID=A0A5A7P823_STRAF|nr:UDP-3-O-acylglucosamine N-acyltransferase [Striga asiatica]
MRELVAVTAAFRWDTWRRAASRSRMAPRNNFKISNAQALNAVQATQIGAVRETECLDALGDEQCLSLHLRHEGEGRVEHHIEILFVDSDFTAKVLLSYGLQVMVTRSHSEEMGRRAKGRHVERG